MSAFKSLALCVTSGLALFSIFLLVQNIQDFGSGIWVMLLIFAGFTLWVFLKLLLSSDKVKSE